MQDRLLETNKLQPVSYNLQSYTYLLFTTWKLLSNFIYKQKLMKNGEQ